MGRTVPGVPFHGLVIVNTLNRAFLPERPLQVAGNTARASSVLLVQGQRVRLQEQSPRSPEAGPSRTMQLGFWGLIRAPGKIIMRSHHHQSHAQFSGADYTAGPVLRALPPLPLFICFLFKFHL